MCGTECQCKNVGLDHPNPRLFVDGQVGQLQSLALRMSVMCVTVIEYSSMFCPISCRYYGVKVEPSPGSLTYESLKVHMTSALTCLRSCGHVGKATYSTYTPTLLDETLAHHRYLPNSVGTHLQLSRIWIMWTDKLQNRIVSNAIN